MTDHRSTPRYALITPARNEADYIRLTLDSMAAQTQPPVRWVIVSDGSTDGTDDIVREYCARLPWLRLVRLPEQRDRSFAAKVSCFNAGMQALEDLSFEIIGNLDADISFDADYFAFLLGKFSDNPRLGVAGTPFVEGGAHYDYSFTNIEHVSGACQLFRRECFEAIGGYVPVKGGGIDIIAVLTARLKGWRTRTFPEKTCVHHRPMGSANHKARLVANFKLGQRAYCVGFHPLWQVFRSIYQMSKKPYVTGGIALFLGYAWAMLRRVDRPISRELIQFQRQDQMKRL